MTTTSKSVFLLALLAGLLFHVSSFAGDTNAPALFCPTPSFDFGRVANRTNVTHVFELVNCGTNRLAIAGAAGSCDACIYGVLKDKVLASGQTTTVAVTCDVIQLVGPLTRCIEILWSDRTGAVLRLEMHGTLYSDEVLHDIYSAPKALYVNKRYALPSEMFLAIHSRSGKRFFVTAARTTIPGVYCHLEDLGERDGWQVILKKIAFASDFEGKEVIVEIEKGDLGELRIPVKVTN